MSPRGNGIRRAAVVALAACLIAAASPLSGSAASHSPRAGVAKKCKKRKHRHKKRRCKRPAPAPAMISISPASQDFGVIAVGGTTRTLAVSNAGGASSGVPAPTISGPDAGSFSIAASTCTTALLPAGSCRIDVHLDFVEPLGVHSGTLSVTASPGGTVSAPMTGDVEI